MIIKDEVLFVVDSNNKPTTPLARNIVHAKGYWHRTSHVWIINNKHELLCQQRSLQKDTNPGMWDSFFGGHLAPHDTYDGCALKEVQEELSLQITRSDLKQYGVFKAEKYREFAGIFVLQWSGDASVLDFEKEEIQELRFLDVSAIEHAIIVEKNPLWTRIGYEEEMFSYLKGI